MIFAFLIFSRIQELEDQLSQTECKHEKEEEKAHRMYDFSSLMVWFDNSLVQRLRC